MSVKIKMSFNPLRALKPLNCRSPLIRSIKPLNLNQLNETGDVRQKMGDRRFETGDMTQDMGVGSLTSYSENLARLI